MNEFLIFYSFLGIFLGYSILQLLEHGLTAIITPMTRLKHFVACWMSVQQHNGPFASRGMNDLEAGMTDTINDSQVIKFESEAERKN